jgi:3-phenylpropionate/trans-cinnamate dioxygenase ferredoxin reductase subunit
MNRQTFVIVGASLAGASAAAALRKEGFDGRIVLIGEESDAPYERPELSKKYLRGEAGKDLAVNSPDFYAEQDIELMTDVRVETVDVHRRVVRAGATRLGFDRLLLTTGAAARSLEVPGAHLDGVMTLRTIAESDAIRVRALDAQHVVVVGGGWIGSEVAASLRQLGRSVTLVIPTDVPLQRVIGRQAGAIYRDVHAANGVRLVNGARVIGLRGGRAVASVELDDRRTLPADLVIAGVGATPRTELASAAGLAVERGIVVDGRLESSVPGVFAAGDVAAAWHPLYGRHIRVEHWDNAKRQGRATAAAMLGRADQYDRIPYLYSDQFDLSMEYTGYAPEWDEVVFRGEPLSHRFIAFWLRRGKVLAGMNVNTWDVAPSIERLVRAQATVERDALADPERPLDELTAMPAAAA